MKSTVTEQHWTKLGLTRQNRFWLDNKKIKMQTKIKEDIKDVNTRIDKTQQDFTRFGEIHQYFTRFGKICKGLTKLDRI